MMFHDVLKWHSQTWHTRPLWKRVVPLSLMTDHWNFQEWLYIDRIFKICIIFKFLYFVVRSLFSAGGPNALLICSTGTASESAVWSKSTLFAILSHYFLTHNCKLNSVWILGYYQQFIWDVRIFQIFSTLLTFQLPLAHTAHRWNTQNTATHLPTSSDTYST